MRTLPLLNTQILSEAAAAADGAAACIVAASP
jgi:hypothetical protein